MHNFSVSWKFNFYYVINCIAQTLNIVSNVSSKLIIYQSIRHFIRITIRFFILRICVHKVSHTNATFSQGHLKFLKISGKRRDYQKDADNNHTNDKDCNKIKYLMLINFNIVLRWLLTILRLVRFHSSSRHTQINEQKWESHEYFWAGNSVPRSIKKSLDLFAVCSQAMRRSVSKQKNERKKWISGKWSLIQFVHFFFISSKINLTLDRCRYLHIQLKDLDLLELQQQQQQKIIYKVHF